ncbi:cytochrome P450 93B2-like [Bidens hawaiensis]|uniref:cytochrome P450 93B2-like n=1 Tax=Bidens hawaiensis TaxID=980011 RepID=UPI00404A36E2
MLIEIVCIDPIDRPSIESHPSSLELKDLPALLEYTFLDEERKLTVIIASALTEVEKKKLLKVLRKHKEAIKWKIIDIKGKDAIWLDTQPPGMFTTWEALRSAFIKKYFSPAKAAYNQYILPNTFQTLQHVTPVVIALVFISSLFVLLFSQRKPNHRLPPSPPSLPIIGHLHHLGPLIHRSFQRLSTLYGPLIHIRLGSVSCVIADTPELAQELLQKNDLAFSNRKHTLAVDHVTYGAAFAFAPYGPYWKFIKKISTVELLGIQNLGHFLPIRTSEIHELLRTLTVKSKQNESVNMTNELLKISNNVICQMMMGILFSANKSEAEEVKNLVQEVTTIFGELNVSDFIWFCRKLDLQGFKKRYEDIRTRYDTLLEKIISQREEMRRNEGKGKVGKGKDFLDLLLDVLEDEKAEIKITRNHIKALILDFITAGTNTSAVIMEWTLVELINNPKVMERAKQEIDTVVGNMRLVKESDAPNLHYIQAILKEAFRLHPPIPMLIRKNENVSVKAGYDIPAGSILFVNNWSIGRNHKYWENPLEFKPERFLEGGVLKTSLDIRGQNFQLLPFGSGRRSCPSINMATRQLPVMISALIQCFEWNVNDKQMLSMDERGGLTAPRAMDLVCFPSLLKNSPQV